MGWHAHHARVLHSGVVDAAQTCDRKLVYDESGMIDAEERKGPAKRGDDLAAVTCFAGIDRLRSRNADITAADVDQPSEQCSRTKQACVRLGAPLHAGM